MGSSEHCICHLISAPEGVAEVSHEKMPAILLRVASLHLALWARLQAPRDAIVGLRNARPEEPDSNLSVATAAERLGVSKDYLYRHSKELPFTVRIGRRLLFSEKGLEKWNRQRRGR